VNEFELFGGLPTLDEPVLAGSLTGWIDASGAAQAATEALRQSCELRLLARFDPDLFIDYRARRPTMELRDGVNTRLVWPDIELWVGTDPSGRDVLVLAGPEPDSNWRRFAAATADLVQQMGCRSAVFFGAYPFATPHTRASRLSCSSPSTALVDSAPFLKNSVDVPAGMVAVLEHALVDRGIEAITVWAQVPHYLGNMGYPAASAALLDGLAQLTGLRLDTTALRTEAGALRQRIDELVGANDEHGAMVRQLESVYDTLTPDTGIGTPQMPSGDELAAEIERFLRGQAPGSGSA
jgi:hypothetical protein